MTYELSSEAEHQADLGDDVVLASAEATGEAEIGEAGVEVADFGAGAYEGSDLPIDTAADVEDSLGRGVVGEGGVGAAMEAGETNSGCEIWRDREFGGEFHFQAGRDE